MTTSAAASHLIPPAMITHSVASIKGHQQADISVYHARTTDARISMTFSGILMVIYSCHAAQGLLEAFAAARGHMARIPRQIPAPRADLDEQRIDAPQSERPDPPNRRVHERPRATKLNARCGP